MSGQTVPSEPVLCVRCGRELHSESSKRRRIGDKVGFGKECKRLALQEQVTKDVPAWQVEKAKTEILALGAIDATDKVNASGYRVFDVISSDAEQLYTTTAESCTCKAGEFGRLCYHSVAAMLLDYRVKVRKESRPHLALAG